MATGFESISLILDSKVLVLMLRWLKSSGPTVADVRWHTDVVIQRIA